MTLQQTVLTKIKKQYTVQEFKNQIEFLVINSNKEDYEIIGNIYLWFSTLFDVEMDCERIVATNKDRVIRGLDCLYRIKPTCFNEECICYLLIEIYEYYLDYAKSHEVINLRRSG